jgi:hypothetical protein
MEPRSKFRNILTVLLGAAVVAAASASAQDIQVRAVRDKREVGIAHAGRVAGKLVALVESCTVNSTAHAVSGGTWNRVLGSASYVHLKFPASRDIRLKGSGNRPAEWHMVREVLLPLPPDGAPPHVYVKTGTETISLTKCDSRALKDLALEEDLRLQELPPYDLSAAKPGTCREVAGGHALDLRSPVAWQARSGCGGGTLVWFQSPAGKDGPTTLWRVDDLLIVPDLEKAQALSLLSPLDVECRHHADRQSLVIAAGEWKRGAGRQRVDRAWRVDPESRKVAEIPVREVSCVLR